MPRDVTLPFAVLDRVQEQSQPIDTDDRKQSSLAYGESGEHAEAIDPSTDYVPMWLLEQTCPRNNDSIGCVYDDAVHPDRCVYCGEVFRP